MEPRSKRLNGRVSANGFDPVGCFEIEHIQHHVFTVEPEPSGIFKSPALKLSIGTHIVDFGRNFDGLVPPREQFIEQHLVDVTADALSTQARLKAAK